MLARARTAMVVKRIVMLLSAGVLNAGVLRIRDDGFYVGLARHFRARFPLSRLARHTYEHRIFRVVRIQLSEGDEI